MPGGARVFASVAIRRTITAQCNATLLTGAEMHPLRSDFHTLSALTNLWQFDGLDSIEMSAASIRHNFNWVQPKRRARFGYQRWPFRPRRPRPHNV